MSELRTCIYIAASAVDRTLPLFTSTSSWCESPAGDSRLHPMSFRHVSAVAVSLTVLCVSTFAADAGTALVRHAPVLNGNVDGSIQQMTGESTTLNGSASVTGDLLVPGTPSVIQNGRPTYGGTVDGTGSTTPTNYQVILNGGVSLRHVVRRTNAVGLPVVAAPPSPTGTRSVALNNAGQSAGDFATLKNLTLNGNVGQVTVPAGVYGDFTANGSS
ncbi:MAG TPA: hypothetical protein VHA37_04755, partial [Candidatus Saccharimonadales bacterium]|nr:hypothetical protein [Candidatus Saccharimonadales bacterium]